ncbi:alpha/beta fold hydrolase [Streptomyces boluensis]|uniref:Alpha/beta fold hydrolase n=1 Tax=Streptomyces boluensis TaxID=1775135 RepID=A0A964UK29_9ACTN|nr:alpha/beta hydrolase [Streptomyces boluensis]NBE50026.1 alpha/beta fold hydrolase [Streptomyces boluensis]
MTVTDPHQTQQDSRATPFAPAWFTSALAAPVDIATVTVAGAHISYRAYGPSSRPGVVLVHGGAAHARWWDHIAPLLASDRRIAAIDLSGHGDSDWRSEYTLEVWAEEVMAVAADAGIDGPPVVVGHSMGGFVTWTVAERHGASLAGAITIDSPVHDLTPEQKAARERRAFGPAKVYPSREAAMARFRPVPAQDTTLPYVREHLAGTSIRRSSTGWSWKFDRRIFASPRMSRTVLKPLECRTALVRSGDGLVPASMGDMIHSRLGCATPLIEIPDAGHHVMLDRPLCLVTALRAVLAEWGDRADGPTRT